MLSVPVMVMDGMLRVVQEVIEQFLEHDVCVWFGPMKQKVCFRH